jgi:hypothetical protein
MEKLMSTATLSKAEYVSQLRATHTDALPYLADSLGDTPEALDFYRRVLDAFCDFAETAERIDLFFLSDLFQDVLPVAFASKDIAVRALEYAGVGAYNESIGAEGNPGTTGYVTLLTHHKNPVGYEKTIIRDLTDTLLITSAPVTGDRESIVALQRVARRLFINLYVLLRQRLY